jgi:hypothetical protein
LDLAVLSSLHERLIRFQPAYTPSFDLAKVAIASALTAGWLWLVLRFPETPARPAVVWAAGMTALWGLVAVLFVRYVDTGNSYRPLVAQLQSQLPASYQCVASRNLGEPQRAMLHYFAGILTYREEQASTDMRPCEVLLVQGLTRGIYQPHTHWVKIWEGSRPGDKSELYRLYRRSDPIETSRASSAKAGPPG